jgi:DNA-binding PadR family transcriptional regulator
MKVDGRIVSLTIRADTPDDAVLLLLYGQKVLRENDSVTGGDIMEGLTATGGTSIGRVDRVLEKMGRDGDVIVIGERRGKRYRLTNAGLSRARQIANSLIAIVA